MTSHSVARFAVLTLAVAALFSFGADAASTSALAQSQPQSKPSLDQYFSVGPGENSYSHGHSAQSRRLYATQDQDIRKGIALIRERLALMRDVAEFKYMRGLPVEDAERERVLLSNLVRKGIPMGLDPRITQAFFADQISAAKILQRNYMPQWRRQRPSPRFSPPDLATVQRPRIDDVTNRLLHSLVTMRNISLRTGGTPALREAALAELRGYRGSSQALSVALRPLLQGLPVEKWKSLRPGAPVVAP